MPFGNYLAGKTLLDHIVNGGAVHMRVHTASPTGTGLIAIAADIPVLNVTGKFGVLGADGATNTQEVLTANATGQVAATHISLWGTAGTDQCLYHGSIQPTTVGAGSALRFLVGALIIRNLT